MTDGPTGDSTVRYEEHLDMRDEAGAGSLVGWVRIAVAFLIISTFVSLVLVVVVATQGLATSVGGFGPLQDFLGDIAGEQTGAVLVLVVAGLLFLIMGVGFVWLFVKNVGRAVSKEVHIQVTDDGVSVSRSGSQYWQSSGVDIPFDSITTVEYVDPDESSFRMELRDFRAPKFFAGRSRNWIRLERTTGPAVYIGSDRPRELANTIAQRVPGDVTPTPF